MFVGSRRVALGMAAFLALMAWFYLDQGTWLPQSLQNLLVGLVFFVIFPLAWALGALGGILGWFTGRRQGRPEFGAAAGVVGFWAGLLAGLKLSHWLPMLLFVLPLLGPWIVVRWLADPLLWAWSAARSRLLDLSDLLDQRLVLERPFRFDARGLALGLLAGLIAAGAGLAGLFRVPEAAALSQGIRLRNEPVRTAAGPFELSGLLGQLVLRTPTAPVRRGIVVLRIDERTEAKVIRESSQAVVQAQLLRKLVRWRSGPVVVPISTTALTVPAPVPPPGRGGPVERSAGPPADRPRGRPPASPDRRGPLARAAPFGRVRNGLARRAQRPWERKNTGPDRSIRTGPVILNPNSPPLDAAAMERETRDLPELVRALRGSGQAVLCRLPERFPGSVDQQIARDLWRGVRDLVPVPNVTVLPGTDKLLATGRPVGSAEIVPFHFRQIQSIRLTDQRGRWALPLLLATGGDRSLVSPPPSPGLTGVLSVRGRRLPLAAPGRLLINLYGSQPGAIFPTASYDAVLSQERVYDPRLGHWVTPAQFFRDQVVFLDTLNQPSYDTPVGAFRATELLAMATDNLLWQNALAPPPARLELLLLVIWGALAGHLSIGRSPLTAAVRVALLACFYWLLAAMLFVMPGVWLPVVSVTAAMGLAYLLTLQFVMTWDARELEQQRSENARFEQEVVISRAIQTSLLPSGDLCAGEFELVSRSDPAREVGGDFFNMFRLEPDGRKEPGQAAPEPGNCTPSERIGIVLGDVSGKGVQGAMYMTVATTLLEAYADRAGAREAGGAPETVLATANAHLYPKIHRLRMFVTAFYGELDVATGRLELASAGQVPPLVARPGMPLSYLATRGLPLGALREAQYERQAVTLARGDTLVLASDGFTEARDARGRALGYDGFLEIVTRHVERAPADCVARIFDDVGRFSGSADDQDDRTLVLIRHRAAAAGR